MEALPGTLMLAIAAMIFATIIGVLLGVLAALKQNTCRLNVASFSKKCVVFFDLKKALYGNDKSIL